LNTPARAWDDIIPGSRYTSARAAALGNAYLPLGDDGASALFYNPADVGKIRATHAEPANVAFTINSGFTDHLGLSSYNVYSLSANQPYLQNNPGSFQGFAGQLVPSVYGKGWAFGMLISDDSGASSDAAGNVRYRARYQLIPAGAFGVRLAGGIIRLGYSFQFVNEAIGDESVSSGTSPLGYNQQLAQGSGFSHMIGVALTLPIAYLPQFDLVARNAFDTSFNGPSLLPVAQSSSGSPATEAMTFDASFSLAPKIDSGVVANLVAELRDMTDRTGIELMGRLCFGMELSIKYFVNLRGGWGEGYPSAGLGFKFKAGEFDISWFSEEIGTTYQGQRDQRYMLQFRMRAF
jgi:hypothetical protein